MASDDVIDVRGSFKPSTATGIDCHPCHRTDRPRQRPEMGLLPSKGKQCMLKSQNNAIDSFVLNKFQVSQFTSAYFASKQTSLYCRVSLLLQFLSVYFASFVLCVTQSVRCTAARTWIGHVAVEREMRLVATPLSAYSPYERYKWLRLLNYRICSSVIASSLTTHSGTVPDDDALCMLNSCYSISLRASVSVGYRFQAN